MYTRLLRPLLFSLPPEAAHHAALKLVGTAGEVVPIRRMLSAAYRTASQTPTQVFGLEFPNFLGLSAGYDKDAVAVEGLAALGFGHIEVGTVTPLPQSGNPKPRLFRLPQDQALINRMGFPGKGADSVARRLARLRRPRDFILGVNLGKNKDTSLDEAYRDYTLLIERFAPLADYLAINLSSPNTVGLRRLQHREFLGSLLTQLDRTRQAQQERLGRRVPLLVKLAPDLTTEELDDILATLLAYRIDGVIATNTTVSREGLRSKSAHETGGLSGQPLRAIATEMIRHISSRVGPELPVVGVGGIASPEDAAEKLRAGASLVQVYTALAYQGPGLIKQIIEKTVQ